ncbi:MAG TPA: hypothetical protein VFI38_16150 [Candidatus Acidoferrum sp.]|nr:hypothetical protein [Candidatus Acidoferrum sp.]
MRIKVLMFAASLLLISNVSPGAPQTPSGTSNSPQRDPQAVTTIQNALVAMGGTSAIAQVQNVIARGSSVPAPGIGDPSGNVTMEDLFSAQGHEFKDAFESATLTQTFVSGHGSPGRLSNGHTEQFAPFVANSRLAAHLPAMLLAGALANATCSIDLIGPSAINGQAAIQVRLHIDTDIVQQTLSVQDWYFDSLTHLPVRIEYRIPDTTNALFFLHAAADFSDFRPVQGVLFPFHLLAYVDSKPRDVLTFSSITVNQPIASADFDLSVAVTQ